jgi:hypothetical protein
VIRWNNNDICFDVKFSDGYSDMLAEWKYVLTVIGNIHDNPELMEENND